MKISYLLLTSCREKRIGRGREQGCERGRGRECGRGGDEDRRDVTGVGDGVGCETGDGGRVAVAAG